MAQAVTAGHHFHRRGPGLPRTSLRQQGPGCGAGGPRWPWRSSGSHVHISFSMLCTTEPERGSSIRRCSGQGTTPERSKIWRIRSASPLTPTSLPSTSRDRCEPKGKLSILVCCTHGISSKHLDELSSLNIGLYVMSATLVRSSILVNHPGQPHGGRTSTPSPGGAPGAGLPLSRPRASIKVAKSNGLVRKVYETTSLNLESQSKFL